MDEIKFKVPEKLLQRSRQRQDRIKSSTGGILPNPKSLLCKLNPSKEVIEIEKLKAKREERKWKRLIASEQSSSLSALEKKVIYSKREIEKFRLQFIAEKDRQEQKDVEGQSAKIQVCVRKRPLLRKELNNIGCFDVVTCKTDQYPNAQIYLHEPRVRLNLSNDIYTHSFSFDHIFDEFAQNSDIHTQIMRPLISLFLSGGEASLFAFGQTASGKTHTIFGGKNEIGLLSLLLDGIFLQYSAMRDYSLRSSFVEIYKDEVLDLYANQNPVKLFEDLDGNLHLHGQKNIVISEKKELLSIISQSLILRSSCQTEANNHSSRSHAIFTLTLWNDIKNISCGKFTLVDLAGAERGYERGISEGAAGINKSLLALKECIRLLHQKRNGEVKNNPHIPFRDSKLTHILRESFIGKNSQTVMICCISPSSLSVEQSLNTLRYGNRVKELRPSARLEEKKSEQKISLPQIDSACSVFNELEKEESFNSSKCNEKIEDIMNEHLKCIIESSKITKAERLIIAKNSNDSAAQKDYLNETIKLMEKKISNWSRLKDKMAALYDDLN